MPFGVGLALFAPDLVEFVLGERWQPATVLLQGLGLLVGLRQLGFNWTLFFQATGKTRPIAVSGVVALIAFVVGIVPLMLAYGLEGYVMGMAVALAADLGVRAFYLSRFFDGFNPMRHMLRAFAPSVPAVIAVLAVRLGIGGDRTLDLAIAEFALYVAVTVLATAFFERRLLREVVGYLRRGRNSSGPLAESEAAVA